MPPEDAATPPSGFVGRGQVLDRLTAVLERALAGRLQLVLLTGEAGIGKTSLAGCLAESASERGASVAWGTSWDSEGAPGFWPWIQVIRSVLRELPDAVVTEFAAGGRSELARIVPELDLDAQPLEVSGSLDQGGFQLFDAALSLLELAARCRPLAIFLDDLQWADSSSLELLRFVCRSARPIPLILVAAYRHDEIEPTSAAAAVVGVGARAPGRRRRPSFDSRTPTEFEGRPRSTSQVVRWRQVLEPTRHRSPVRSALT
ncbi:MAG: ATP-binding protein [Actinomycetota bacterium]|nr:ATP-binding protein [Actinomycetota bacterium]